MSNHNPQATHITTVDEAQKSQVASQSCNQLINSEGNIVSNIKIENVHFTVTSEQDKTKSSATQNQSFMKRIANYFLGEATSSTKQNPTTIDDATLNLQRKLQLFYQDVTLPCVAWLDTGEDLILSNYYTELQLDSSKTTITIDQIFDKINDKEPNRILIEGQPGYGKTTLATKLIYDWAVQEKYIKHFKLAFLLPLRELQKRSVEQAMINIANLCGFKNNSCLKDILQNNISNILLIVDGLDELAVTDRMPILKLLYKQEYAQITVIVTCRTGSFTPGRDELTELFAGISKKKVFYDKRVDVLGISIKNRTRFLLNFIPIENAEDIITKIKVLTELVEEMFKSPLLLILLAFIASNENDITAVTTKTDLFKQLFNCIINRSLKTQEHNEYDLFNLNSTLNKIQNTIQQYGKQALHQLVDNKMQFECDDLTKEIYQLGFLIENKQISSLHSHTHYEAFHRSILEFAAAFSLWINFKQDHSSADAFHHIQSIYPQLDKTSLVVPFLIGLLQDEACHIFNQFTSHAHFFSAINEIFWIALAEYPTNKMWNKLLPSIIPFIPAVIGLRSQNLIRMLLPDLFEKIIQVGIENNRIKEIIVFDESIISRLPKNVIIPQLWLFAKVYNQELINSLQGIQCKEFTLMYNQNYHNCDINILNLFSLNFAQSYSLHLHDNGNFCKLMYEHINDDFMQQIQLTQLIIFKYNPTLKHLIPILLKRNQVQGLIWRRFDNSIQLTDYYEIISAASISSCLHSMELKWGHSGNELVIDLFDLTQGGKKKYTNLSFTNCQIVSKKEIQDKNCIRSIIINNDEEFQSKQRVSGLNAIEPEFLQCNLSAFHQLSQSWKGYVSINQLVLHLEKKSFENIENWSFLSNCKNIKKITLVFSYENSVPSDATRNEILTYMKQLPIEELGINFDELKKNEEKLCKFIAKSLPWTNKDHPLETVKFTCESWIYGFNEIISSTILDYLECLKLRYLKMIKFSPVGISCWDSLMRLNIIDLSLFSITHSYSDEYCIKLKD